MTQTRPPALLATLLAAVLAGPAAAADAETVAALREGSLKKLVVSEPQPAALDVVFLAPDGSETSLAAHRGQVVLLNFWATWCAPCRKEMPALDALQAAHGGPDFQVVTVATGRNPPAALTRFFEEEDIENLPLNTDPKQELARNMRVLGLPVTVLIDREGNEVARLVGDADWNSPSAHAIVEAMIGAGG